MKISLYTAMRNCLKADYPCVEMLKHHLPLADEIVVNEGFSTDGTYEAITNLDPKIRIFRTQWNPPAGEHWWIHFKDAARRACTGDWCIHLDSDEFIPEWQFETIRQYLQTTSDVMIPVTFTNFYGNAAVYHSDPGKSKWVTKKMIIHRNAVEEIAFWGDGSNVKLRDREFTWDTSPVTFDVHHFGAVRHAGTLREAWWSAGRFRAGRSIQFQPPRFVFDLFPHKWNDPDFLPYMTVYDGPFIKAVRDDPRRFVRDGFELLDLLGRRPARWDDLHLGAGTG